MEVGEDKVEGERGVTVWLYDAQMLPSAFATFVPRNGARERREPRLGEYVEMWSIDMIRTRLFVSQLQYIKITNVVSDNWSQNTHILTFSLVWFFRVNITRK